MLVLLRKTKTTKKLYSSFTMVLLFSMAIFSAPILYSYSGFVDLYDIVNHETRQSSISLQMLAGEEIRTYATSLENPSIRNSFDLELQSLIVDGTEILSSPVSGITFLQQYEASTYFSIDFEYSDLKLYIEEEYASIIYDVNPIPLFEIRYNSPHDLSNGVVYFSTMKNVPEPGILQLVGFGIIGISPLIYYRKKKCKNGVLGG